MNSKVVLGVIVMIVITLGSGIMVLPSYASLDRAQMIQEEAPTVVSGDNVYIVWFTNESTANSNYEVGFRASNDSGATFGPITNLSNTDNADSINAEISAEGGNIIVSWWERNQTAMIPVARVSTEYGETFGNRLNITASPFGSIGAAEEE
jgi:hypothetical protein